MSRLDTHRLALSAADPAVGRAELLRALDEHGSGFGLFVVDHGLGPLWHERTGHEAFRDSRMAAEASFVVQQAVLLEIDEVLTAGGIEHALIKGAANRLLLYQNPALRACHDLDLLVRHEDRLRTVAALMQAGFVPTPDARSISRELVLTRGPVDVDLHWGLLREGRLRGDMVPGMLARRRRVGGTWALSDDDALFVLLVHPAFAKHLESWEMGLHRVADLMEWLRRREFDWATVRRRLAENGVSSAAWATLRWVQLLAGKQAPGRLASMLPDLAPGVTRSGWLDHWLRADLSTRTAGAHWLRLLAFSPFLHDTPQDALRAWVGRRRAQRRSRADLEAFSGLLGQ
jgi:hypothetical protein